MRIKFIDLFLEEKNYYLKVDQELTNPTFLKHLSLLDSYMITINEEGICLRSSLTLELHKFEAK